MRALHAKQTTMLFDILRKVERIEKYIMEKDMSREMAKSIDEEGFKCFCNISAKRKISRSKANPNRPFYACGNTNGQRCKFFMWDPKFCRTDSDTYEKAFSSNESTVLSFSDVLDETSSLL